MFNKNIFLQKLNRGEFEGLKDMFLDCHPERSSSEDDESLLEAMVQAEELNRALIEKKELAIDLMNEVLARNGINRANQNSFFKEKALLFAVKLNFCATAARVFNFLKEHYLGFLPSICQKQDEDKNTILHYAVIHCNDKMIGLLALSGAMTELFLIKNKNHLHGLGLAFDCYQKNPNDLTISVCNQLYFSLPKGVMRTLVVEEEVKLGYWRLSKPLWRYALRFCAKRDSNKKITSVDMNFIDLVNQVIGDGLMVMGYHVDWQLIYAYSKAYSGTPGQLLADAVSKIKVDLSGRTLGQTAVNATLAKNQEFLSRAKLENDSFTLGSLQHAPMIDENLSGLRDGINYIVSYKDNLFYVPKKTTLGGSREYIHIIREQLYDNDKEKFDALLARIQSQPHLFFVASPADLKNIFAVLPVQVATKVDTSKTTLPKSKGTGMTLFSNYLSLPSYDNLLARQKNKPAEKIELMIRRKTYSLSSSESE